MPGTGVTAKGSRHCGKLLPLFHSERIGKGAENFSACGSGAVGTAVA